MRGDYPLVGMRQFLLVFIFVLRDFSKARTIFSMVVVSLAIAATSILSTNSILAGFQEMLATGVRGWIGDIIIIPPEKKTSLGHAEDIVADLRTLEHVEAVSLRGGATGAFRYQDTFSYPFTIVGVETDTETLTTGLPETITSGEFFDTTMDSESVVLGMTFADSFKGGPYDGEGVVVGDDIQFSQSDGSTKSYRIKGIVDAKNFIPNSSAFLQKNEAEKMDVTHRNNAIIVKLADASTLEAVKDTITKRHPDVIVHTWLEESGYIEDIMETVRYITTLISSLLIFSVFFIIAIVIFINISQKKRQIGIMKSMGATTSFIVSIYVLEAILYFSLAYALGVGMFLLIHLFSIAHPAPLLIGDFHTVLDWQRNFLYFIILLVSAFLGGLVPSLLASRNKIIDTLRSI